MINSLEIKGFKCFDNISIKLKSITLLVGRNSVGKSTIIQSILAMKQGQGNPFRGELMDLGEVPELMNTYTGTETIDIVAETDDVKERAYIHIDGLNVSKMDVKPLNKEIVYCSAERIGVRDTYDKSVDDSRWVGTDCRYAFSYLNKHKKDDIDLEFVYDPESLLTLGGQVDYWLSEIVGCRIDVIDIKDTNLVQVKYSKQKEDRKTSWNRPQNVGTGVTYAAAAIIAAFSCCKGGLLIIENPEIHLHPAAQSKFLEFLGFISLCGVQVIIESHSDHIFNGIRRCIHEDLIDISNQSIYFFRNIENGCSEPVLIRINKDGRLLNMEEGLFDQMQKDLDVILGW